MVQLYHGYNNTPKTPEKVTTGGIQQLQEMINLKAKKYKLNNFAQRIEQELRRESFEIQYYYENEYLNEHNLTCPLCKGRIKKNFKNILTGAYIIGMIKLEEQRTTISYTLCKKCSNGLMQASQGEKHKYETIISSHVINTINV